MNLHVRYRYHHDTSFKMAVDMIQGFLERGLLTTEDVAHAAVLAAQMYAERNSCPVMIKLVDGRKEGS